jgi:hypothetical protein
MLQRFEMDWAKQTAAWKNNKFPVLKIKHLHRARLYLTSPLPETYQVVAVHKKQVVGFLAFRDDKEVMHILQAAVNPTWPQQSLIYTITKWAGELTGSL